MNADCDRIDPNMALAAGSKLGPYEIIGLLGKGGMGEVYRARDPRLNRDVAIKVSTQEFSERFEREAKVVASLNHPNICHLYDVGPNYLVMELVEGEAPKGPMPLEEALRIAQQIVAALEAAHEKGVTHRDLKPANIKVKSDGAVKVLDFGLAKSAPDPGSQETVSMSLTESGVVVGTAAYMSPEQAQGKEVDKRSDIWAFGVVFYELLSGQRLFKGDSMADTLVQVMTKTPDWTRIPANVQPLLRRCLERDPHRRLRDIGDSMALLETASTVAPGVEPAPSRRPWLLWGGFAAATLAALALAILYFGQQRPSAEPVRLQIALPEDVNAANRNFALSPDGRKLAFSAAGPDGVARVWVRLMDSPDVRELPGSETTINAPPFFWDPDSRLIAYTGPGSKLKKVDLLGSPPQTLSDTTGLNAVGGSWNTDNVLIFGSGAAGLTRVSASGGMPSPVTVPDKARGETRHAFPTFLPDNRHFLYLRSSPTVPENSGVYIGSLDVKPEEQDSKLLLATTFGPAYAPSLQRGRGFVLFLREGTLWANSFDEGRMELLGDPVSLVQQVNSNIAAGAFSASLNGVLVYRASAVSLDGRVLFLGRTGTPLSQIPAQPPVGLRAVALSPDEARAALVRQDPANPMNRNIWTWDTKQGSSAQMTFDPGLAESPVWSHEGSRIFYRSNRDGAWNLYRKLANSSKDDEVLVKTPQDKTPTGISRDGSLLLYTQTDPKTKNDVWVLSNPSGIPGEKKAILNGEANESDARFSPETGASGPRWVAYTSDESGRAEVWVREYPQGSRWPISTQGGTNARWRGDGKELFFAALDGSVMAVEVTAGAAFQHSPPMVLSKPGVFPNWDVAADGKRFLALLRGAGAQAPFTVWQNWRESLPK